MCNGRFKQVKYIFMLLVLLISMSGCMPSHSDTLVFGTNTKLAVDLSINSTTNVPSLTVGYTRQEGVWMPLYVNARDSRFTNSSSAKTFKNFSSNTSGLKYVGNQGGDRDTYSVLASFGADVKAGNEATVGIAQYFATGLAARKLADQGGDRLVSVHAPSEAELQSAIKRADIAEKKIFEIQGIATHEYAVKSAQLIPEIDRKVDRLKKETAILLATNPPASNASIDSIIIAMDPNNLRLNDETVAKTSIKRRILLGEKSVDYLIKWDKVLDAYTTP